MPVKSKPVVKKQRGLKPKTYVKKSLSLASTTVETRLHVWGFKSGLRAEAACDLRFRGDVGEFTAYLSVADARALALFILDNAREGGAGV